ncbi:MAG: hypothetical protein AUI36_10645 [Cyanobacteria bacterium 13_1_40CM_2_61_4]|nr:MAG: hypothetical protein AUI36_10645 [Cyanobacteria bacterium 13_1_40CM_2_61_4]
MRTRRGLREGLLPVNIMSIGGIIVAIGDMVDASIVMVHNAHRRLEDWERNGRVGDRTQMLMDSAMVTLESRST